MTLVPTARGMALIDHDGPAAATPPPYSGPPTVPDPGLLPPPYPGPSPDQGPPTQPPPFPGG